MVSSVTSRPSHYEMLGLTATASEAEIGRAFASRMSLFGTHAPGEAARLCAAYEVLRDSAKRRDYDRSIGLGPKPEPRQWAFAVTQSSWPGFVGSAAAPSPVEALTAPAAPPAGPLVTAPHEPEASPEIERASAIAASLRRLAEPPAVEPSKPEPAAEWSPLPRPEPVAEMDIYRILDRRLDRLTSSGDDQPFEWRRPALVVGGLIGAAGFIGAFAGLSVKDDAATAAAPPAITIPLPAAKQVADAAAAPPTAPIEMAAATAPPAQPRHTPSQSRFARAVQQQVSAAAAEPQRIDLVSAEAAADPAEPQPVAASLPLPDAVVARTIERIGYSCGKVTGATAGAAPGVYQVTCSSGDTYQATPVHGRYRFRRSR